jgi:RNA polymerase sigma-70 factor (ECF subfamily)
MSARSLPWNLSGDSDNHHRMQTLGSDERPDGDLVRRAAAGERDAFAAIYERYRSGVYRFARLMSGSDATAEDVTQEVFVTLMRTLPRYDSHRAELLTYLYGVARNVTRNRLRRDRRFVALDAAVEGTPSSADDPCAAASRAEQLAQLRRSVLALPSRYREVVILCNVHGLSYAETARVLRAPIGTVRSRLNRGRQLIAIRMRKAESPGHGSAARIERCVV